MVVRPRLIINYLLLLLRLERAVLVVTTSKTSTASTAVMSKKCVSNENLMAIGPHPKPLVGVVQISKP